MVANGTAPRTVSIFSRGAVGSRFRRMVSTGTSFPVKATQRATSRTRVDVASHSGIDPKPCTDLTLRKRVDIMAAMFRRVARATVPCLAVSFLVFGSGLAPLHAHESDVTHSPAVIHSHFDPHHQVAHHDESKPEIDHGEHIVWLEMSVVHALPFQLVAPAAVLIRVPDVVSRSRCWSVITFDDSAPPHGPPRSGVALRAPPTDPV